MSVLDDLLNELPHEVASHRATEDCLKYGATPKEVFHAHAKGLDLVLYACMRKETYSHDETIEVYEVTSDLWRFLGLRTRSLNLGIDLDITSLLDVMKWHNDDTYFLLVAKGLDHASIKGLIDSFNTHGPGINVDSQFIRNYAKSTGSVTLAQVQSFLDTVGLPLAQTRVGLAYFQLIDAGVEHALILKACAMTMDLEGLSSLRTLKMRARGMGGLVNRLEYYSEALRSGGWCNPLQFIKHVLLLRALASTGSR